MRTFKLVIVFSILSLQIKAQRFSDSCYVSQQDVYMNSSWADPSHSVKFYSDINGSSFSFSKIKSTKDSIYLDAVPLPGIFRVSFKVNDGMDSMRTFYLLSGFANDSCVKSDLFKKPLEKTATLKCITDTPHFRFVDSLMDSLSLEIAVSAKKLDSVNHLLDSLSLKKDTICACSKDSVGIKMNKDSVNAIVFLLRTDTTQKNEFPLMFIFIDSSESKIKDPDVILSIIKDSMIARIPINERNRYTDLVDSIRKSKNYNLSLTSGSFFNLVSFYTNSAPDKLCNKFYIAYQKRYYEQLIFFVKLKKIRH